MSSASTSLSRLAAAPNPFLHAADQLDPPPPPPTGVLQYYDHPDRFATDCIRWPAGRSPTPYQLNNLRLLVEHRRLAVRGPHGLGKSAGNTLAILWFSLTRDAAGVDWKVPTTASVWRQLIRFLWPEVHKWARMIDWERVGRAPFNKGELLDLSLKLNYGSAFAIASNQPEAIEGVHADEVLYIFDEAKAIADGTFDAAEGAFSGAGADTPQQAYALASSTPGAPAGRFYEIHARHPGLEDWRAVHVTLQDTIDAGRVSSDWAEQRARQWGRKSAVFINRALGEFAAADEDGIIPLAWVEAANERWQELFPNGVDPEEPAQLEAANLGHLDALGIDVARSGADKTVLALRFGHVIPGMRERDKQETMETAGQAHGLLERFAHPARQIHAVVDVIGIGAGVVDRLRETSKQRIVAFNASERSDRKDRTGELGFVNARAAAWWNLRDLLDPASTADPVALPPHDRLIGELTTPHWRVVSGGQIQVESKDDIKKRLDGRSTDFADAIVMAFWPDGGPKIQVPWSSSRPSRHRIQ